MKPILKRSPESGTYYTPDKRFKVSHNPLYGWEIGESDGHGEYFYCATVQTLAEARRLVGESGK